MTAPHVVAARLAPFPGYFLCYPAQRQMAVLLCAFIGSVRSQARA